MKKVYLRQGTMLRAPDIGNVRVADEVSSAVKDGIYIRRFVATDSATTEYVEYIEGKTFEFILQAPRMNSWEDVECSIEKINPETGLLEKIKE